MTTNFDWVIPTQKHLPTIILPIAILLISTLPIVARAELPLTVDELLADKNKFVLETALYYHNHSDNKNTINSDTIVPIVGLRYGISDTLDIGIKTKALYRNHRYDITTPNASDSRLQELLINTQYQVSKNHKTLPDTVVFAELSAYDNTQGLIPKWGAKTLIGSTIYHTYDPLALSLTTTYLHNTNRQTNNTPNNTSNQINNAINIGDNLSINGQVGFAVNPDISLIGGIGWQLKQADKQNQIPLNRTQTQTYLDFGLTYNLNQRSSISTAIRTNVSGDEGSIFSVGLTTKLGELPTPLSQKYRQKQLLPSP